MTIEKLKQEVRQHFNAYAPEYESMIHNQFDELIDYLAATNRFVQEPTGDRADLAKEEQAHLKTIDQRDYYHDQADALAKEIARVLEIDIGEHSSANCPWTNALEAIEQAPALSTPPVPSEVLQHVAEVLNDMAR